MIGASNAEHRDGCLVCRSANAHQNTRRSFLEHIDLDQVLKLSSTRSTGFRTEARTPTRTWQVAGLCALGQFWRQRRPHTQRIGRTAGHADRTKPRRTHPAFCGCAVWNTQRSDRLYLPMSAQRNLSHDMETYSSGTRVGGYACEHSRICAAPQTRLLPLPRWATLLFESVRAGRWHAYPLGSMEPLM